MNIPIDYQAKKNSYNCYQRDTFSKNRENPFKCLIRILLVVRNGNVLDEKHINKNRHIFHLTQKILLSYQTLI